MTPTWRSEGEPVYPPIGPLGWLRVLLRGVLLVLVLLAGVVTTLLLRIVEAPIHGQVRPWTGWVTVWVCRIALLCVRLKVRHVGRPMDAMGILAANHSSWLDIFVLNSARPLYFVSKAEVAKWPGIGGLARLTGTVFVRRDAREAGHQRTLLEDRIAVGHRLLFFPEGTSTDGRRILVFKPTLFAAVFSDRLGQDVSVQPVTVAYQAPKGRDPRFYGWWGDMEFGSHLLRMLAADASGQVDVTWHAPLSVADFRDRKLLAKAAEAAVRSAHPLGEAASA